MKISKRQLHRIVEQHMADWYDEEMGYETMADRKYADSIDDDLEDDGYGDSEYDRGYQDALEGLGIAHDATPEYEAGFEDGSLDSDMEDEWAIQDQLMAEGIWDTLKSLAGSALEKLANIAGYDVEKYSMSEKDEQIVEKAEATLLKQIKTFQNQVAGGLTNAGMDDDNAMKISAQVVENTLSDIVDKL